MEDERNEFTTGILILACSILSWIFLHRWSQRTKKGPKTWPLVGAAIEQLMNFNRMHDWLVHYLAESRTVVVPMPFTTYTYIADPENNINDKSLRDVVLNFVIAGRDTTATTLSWAIYMIMTHDHVAERLHAELKAFEEDRAKEENVSLHSYKAEDPESFNLRAKQYAGLLSYDSLGKLYYLHAVITETLRLFPYSMGRMEYNWGPDATSFKPERWLKDGLFQNASPFKFKRTVALLYLC